jgi:hypothetical protein
MMGDQCVETGCDATGLIPPLHAYGYVQLERCAVIGGPVYRGCRMPGHHGRYFFSDFCAAFVHSLRWSAVDDAPVVVVDHPTLSDRLAFVSGFGVDADGEILVLDWEAGEVHRIVPAP